MSQRSPPLPHESEVLPDKQVLPSQQPMQFVRGTVLIEWLEGERFLIHRARTDHPDFPGSIAIIGFTEYDRIGEGPEADPATPGRPQLKSITSTRAACSESSRSAPATTGESRGTLRDSRNGLPARLPMAATPLSAG